jgi:hypothetical protein
MKARKFPLVVLCLVAFSFILSGCYRDQIPLDEKRASQQVIPIEQAKAFQNRFIETHRELTQRMGGDTSGFMKTKFVLSHGESFNRDMIALLLNQKGADGIRIYLGQDEKGEVRLVLLPIDKDGKDIITTLIANSTALKIPGISQSNAGTGGQAGETGQNCYPCTIGN